MLIKEEILLDDAHSYELDEAEVDAVEEDEDDEDEEDGEEEAATDDDEEEVSAW